MKLCDKERAEILNRLREGKHTSSDLEKLKERCVEESSCPREAPRLFITSATRLCNHLGLYVCINVGLRSYASLRSAKC
jgi:hypothetical protein